MPPTDVECMFHDIDANLGVVNVIDVSCTKSWFMSTCPALGSMVSRAPHVIDLEWNAMVASAPAPCKAALLRCHMEP